MKKLLFMIFLSGCLYGQSWFTFTIDSLGTTSNAVNLGFQRPVAMKIDSLTGTHITFKTAIHPDSLFLPIREQDSTLVTYPVTERSIIVFDINDFYGINVLEIVSDSTEAKPRTIKIRCERISGDLR